MKNRKAQSAAVEAISSKTRDSFKEQFHMEIKPAFLFDRLREHLVFEKNSIRLYNAMMRKTTILKEASAPARQELYQLRDGKLDQIFVLLSALQEIGEPMPEHAASEEVETPLDRSQLQTLSERSTTLSQCLSILLDAEQSDQDGWYRLIQFAKSAGFEAMAKKLEQALLLEEEHLKKIRFWISQTAVFAEVA